MEKFFLIRIKPSTQIFFENYSGFGSPYLKYIHFVYIIIAMKYEWDENKNKNNILKHGLDFTDAILVFDTPLLIAEDTRNDYGETRISGIGTINNIFVVIIYTEDEEKDIRRIISFRKATKKEREFYENNI